MKRSFLFLFLISPAMGIAQINCPAFGRMQNYERFEVLLTWNTVDAYPNFAGIDLQNDVLQFGDYKNQSIAPGITFNYYADNITVLRLKGIYTKRDVHVVSDPIDSFGSGTHVETQLDQILFKIAPGFGWAWFVERFSFYGGFEIPYTNQSDLKVTQHVVDSVVGVGTIESNSTTTIPGGFSLGLGAYAGSTFFFPRIFGIGFEVASAYQYTKLGGTIRSEGETNENPPVEFSSEYFDQKEIWKFSPVQASLHLSIRF